MWRMISRRPIIAGIIVVLVVAAGVFAGLRVRQHTTAPVLPQSRSDHVVTIPTRSGDRLAAEVFEPKTAGSHPLVVMPSSWAQTYTEYHVLGGRYAQAGYDVVAYTPSGFGTSTGQVDFAGPTTIADASDVITWALEHTTADPKHVGMLGISYGAGVSLLTAAHDQRVRAVAAMSTWTDLAACFDTDNTPSTLAVRDLLPGGKGRYADSIRQMMDAATSAPTTVGTLAKKIAGARSPIAVVQKLNVNDPAIMVANAYEDSIIPPSQLLTFYDRLTTPKRLQLSAGDHAGPEISGLTGAPNRTLSDAEAWLNRYLTGAENGIDNQKPLQLQDIRTNQVTGYAAWPKVPKADTVALGKPGATDQVGTKTPWRQTVVAGTDSGADTGVPSLLTGGAFTPATLQVSQLSTAQSWSWVGDAASAVAPVVGSPRLHVRIGSSAKDATVFVYLYDVDPLGSASLMDWQPFTALDLPTGSSRSVDITMQPISWTVPVGDHVLLVVDTVDARWQSLTPAGQSITLSSTKSDPASITLPITSTG